MADKIYPTAKPTTLNGTGATAAAATTTPFPPTKAQQYGLNRPIYNPQSTHHRRRHHRRGCCCTLCIWLTLAVILLVFAAAAASAVVYLLYRPHRPTFTVTALKLSHLNITSSSTIDSRFDLNVTARNPNKKLIYTYGTIDVQIYSDGVEIGDGSFPGFVHGKKNTTLLKSTISAGNSQTLESDAIGKLRSGLKSKSGLSLKIRLETKVKVKMGIVKTPRIGIRVTCVGIRVTVPAGNATSRASTGNAKCKVDPRIKIWKWVV